MDQKARAADGTGGSEIGTNSRLGSQSNYAGDGALSLAHKTAALELAASNQDGMSEGEARSQVSQTLNDTAAGLKDGPAVLDGE